MSEEKVIKEKINEFVKEIEAVDADFARRLDDTLWDMYLKAQNPYNIRPIPDWALDKDDTSDNIITLEDWEELLGCGGWISDDGSAYYGTETTMSNLCAIRNAPPAWATRVILFGK